MGNSIKNMCIELNHKCYCSLFDWRLLFYEKAFYRLLPEDTARKKPNELPNKVYRITFPFKFSSTFHWQNSLHITWLCIRITVIILKSCDYDPNLLEQNAQDECRLFFFFYWRVVAFLRYTMFSLWIRSYARKRVNQISSRFLLLLCCYCCW